MSGVPRLTIAAAQKTYNGGMLQAFGLPKTKDPLLDALLADMERGDGKRTAYEAVTKAPATILPRISQ